MKLLTVREAAECLGLKVSTIRGWTLRRRIEFVKVGRLVRIRQEVIDELVARNTVPIRPTPSTVRTITRKRSRGELDSDQV